jgi:hypothetical protein
MGSSIRWVGIAVFVACAVFSFSCEKHHVGELATEGAGAHNEAITPVPEKSPAAPPTPAEFFPTATPR